ncbi:MAG: alpha amylase C-terminal domain-containing protein, partial [Bacteroidia bacterium]|nr:alpha amylase C-terminal domain-containing protein [Bacteroidia bacterium]
EHQKWYNRGRCDGGKLSEPQRYLRRAYASLLRLAACSEAINKGGFYDLQYINRHHQSEGFDERYHYAFIRHSQKEKLVVVVNFNRSEKYRIHLRIPPDALKHSGIPSSRKLKVSELLTGSLETEIYPADLFREGDRFSGLVLDVPPKQAYILRFD